MQQARLGQTQMYLGHVTAKSLQSSFVGVRGVPLFVPSCTWMYTSEREAVVLIRWWSARPGPQRWCGSCIGAGRSAANTPSLCVHQGLPGVEDVIVRRGHMVFVADAVR